MWVSGERVDIERRGSAMGVVDMGCRWVGVLFFFFFKQKTAYEITV